MVHLLWLKICLVFWCLCNNIHCSPRMWCIKFKWRKFSITFSAWAAQNRIEVHLYFIYRNKKTFCFCLPFVTLSTNQGNPIIFKLLKWYFPFISSISFPLSRFWHHIYLSGYFICCASFSILHFVVFYLLLRYKLLLFMHNKIPKTNISGIKRI